MALWIEVAEPNRTRRYELGVIEDIEQLSPELQAETLSELGVLQDGKIPIVHTWPVEEPPVCVAFLTQRRALERTGIKKETRRSWARGFPRIQGMDGSDKVGGVHVKGNRPAKAGAQQRLVIGLHQCDGKARGKPRDPADS